MQQLIENLAVDLRKNFGEMHRQLVNLDSAVPISGCGSITGTRLCMHILNFGAAYTIYTAPATLDKHRQTRKQQAMSSPAARSITCYSKIPEFLVGNIGQPMPAVGLGTASHPFVAEDVRTAVPTALELGYRHIDAAAL
ncbi:unnamed protein product [Miscanthus lutarioriparius]|uniref:Uncharacterized protein n=1 Tax=Miscanthus lutarioriparius TaxID=422564 RepID=A0A811MQ56_9POAL|nr:unnamed protein product [Miscanthus lutarioriparius]